MKKNEIEGSQQQSQGITIGTQGNEDMVTPEGTEGPHQSIESPTDRTIPNQERSSARNQEKEEGSRGENP